MVSFELPILNVQWFTSCKFYYNQSRNLNGKNCHYISTTLCIHGLIMSNTDLYKHVSVFSQKYKILLIKSQI